MCNARDVAFQTLLLISSKSVAKSRTPKTKTVVAVVVVFAAAICVLFPVGKTLNGIYTIDMNAGWCQCLQFLHPFLGLFGFHSIFGA